MVSELCQICHSPAHGCHFGVPACKACTAFFRRTVARKHEYRCKNDGKCAVSSVVRANCKGCRYSKCIRSGMKTHEVQKYRDIYGKRTSSEPIEPPIRHTLTLLQNIVKNYAHLESIRLLVHNRHSDRGVLLKRDPRALNYKETGEVFLNDSFLILDWISSSFPDFGLLSSSQQSILFRNLYPQFVVLEGGFFSFRNNRCDIRYLPSGDYIDCVNPETYYFDPEGRQSMTPEEAVKTFASSFSTYRRNVWTPMLRESVDCFEFLVLVGLALFDESLDALSEETLAVCRKNREMIQREVLHYYRSTRKERDYFVRLGNILTIIPNLQRATRRFHEDVELSNVLKAYSVDPKFYETCFGKF